MVMTTEPTAREMIPALLDQYRPDRYDPRDHSWQAPVVDLVAVEISDAEARQIAAERLVSTAEGTATRRTNKMLREIAESGSWPLDWFEAMSWPLAVDDVERVALRAAEPADFERFANRERRAAANDFAARNSSCEGALHIAELMRGTGCRVASDLVLVDVARAAS